MLIMKAYMVPTKADFWNQWQLNHKDGVLELLPDKLLRVNWLS